jgi:hypothetical protein
LISVGSRFEFLELVAHLKMLLFAEKEKRVLLGMRSFSDCSGYLISDRIS